MNIFVLVTDIRKCAQYPADQHVSRMILESAKMYCRVLNQLGVRTVYSSTHLNYPCTIWARRSRSNWLWLNDLAALSNEALMFLSDNSCEHQSMDVVIESPGPKIAEDGFTLFAQAMADDANVPGDAV